MNALDRFSRWAQLQGLVDIDPGDYDGIWRWSTADLAGFWSAVAEYFDTEFSSPADEALQFTGVDDATWFKGATLNYAREALRGADEAIALRSYDETGWIEDVTYGELRGRVAALAARLVDAQVGIGDVVAGYLRNRSEAAVAFLAAASVGATWTQCAPDYGAAAALDRFAQVKPAALIAAAHYRFGGKDFDRSAQVSDIVAGLDQLKLVVITGDEAAPGEHSPVGELKFAEVPFDHPLWVLFTSGTTGKPKGIVHGHGGIVLEHRKLLAFHLDVNPGEALFWYSSTNWVMWNIQVGALLVDATAVLYDGSPTWPATNQLWEVADQSGCTTFGANPGYFSACERAGIRPARGASMRMVGSTGSVLTAASQKWLVDELGSDITVNSISGGTDVASAFVGAAPSTPVWPGELSRPCLGAAVESWSSDGRQIVGEQGEMIVTLPMPSMPLTFWDDTDGARLHETYFSMFPGVWRQGDSITHTPHGSIVIHGRSDATLNRNGVRFGSAEIYDVVERHPAIVDALVVGVDGPPGQYWMPLFIVCAEGENHRINELADELNSAIRTGASPRHVPDDVIVVDALPRTRTGKRLEVPTKKALQGDVSEAVLSRGAIDNENAWNELLDVGLARRPW